jgi:hypothetical protein
LFILIKKLKEDKNTKKHQQLPIGARLNPKTRGKFLLFVLNIAYFRQNGVIFDTN